MESLFEAGFFVANRAKLRTLFKGTAPIIITAHGLLQSSGTMNFPFRQDSNFWYLTGIDEPDIILVMDKQKEYLILPERAAVMDIIDGAFDTERLARRSGISTVLSAKDGWKLLGARLKRVKHIATVAPPPAYIEFYNLYTNPARAQLLTRIKDIQPDIEPLDLRQHLALMRMVKQPVELQALTRAIALTIATLKTLSRRNFVQYAHEYQVEADITAGFRKRGAMGHAFTPIVASGQNACTVHYFANNTALDKKGLMVVDVGAEVEHYAADISRTYSLSKPTKRQQQVYDAVKETQAFAMQQLKPGVTIKEYEKTMEAYQGEKMRELGLIKSIEREAIRHYNPMATSHHLGLDTHDAADYERPLEAGMVLTVEPGIYIPEEGIGVRIEDDVLLKKNGLVVLSKGLPAELKRNGKIELS